MHNPCFPQHCNTNLPNSPRPFSDWYLFDDRQEHMNLSDIEKMCCIYNYIKITDEEIMERMHPNIDGIMKHSGKSRGDIIEDIMKERVGDSYYGLQDAGASRMVGWQAFDARYDHINGISYYFLKNTMEEINEEES